MRAIGATQKDTADQRVGSGRPLGCAAVQDRYDDSRTLSDPAWNEYDGLSPEPVGLGEQPAETREAEWTALRRLARVMDTGVTAWGWRHRDMTEQDIRDEAERRISTLWQGGRSLWGASYRSRYDREPPVMARVDRIAARRAERRAMRRCVRQALEATALLHGQVGSRGHQARYASRFARARRADQINQQAEWLSTTSVVDVATGEAIPLARIARTPRQRRAELHVVTRGMIAQQIAMGRWPHFITLTLAPQWHPAPKFGKSKWDGSLPVEGQLELRRRWAVARRRMHKAGIRPVGGRFVEPHADAAPHWHLIVFLTDTEIERVVAILTAVFGSAPAVQIERARSAEGAVKYCMAYSAKTAACGAGKIGQHISGDDLSGVDTWRSTWSVRGFQLFGIGGRLRLWRECRRRIEDAPPELAPLTASARSGDYAAFAAAADATGACLWTLEEKREYPDPDPTQQHRAAAHGQQATIIVRRRRTVGVFLEAHGPCGMGIVTRWRRWVLWRSSSAAASAAALANSCISATPADASESVWRGRTPPSTAPPCGAEGAPCAL